MTKEARLPLTEVGKYRGSIVDYEVKEFDSGSVLVKLYIEVEDTWEGNGWRDIKKDCWDFVGDVWVVGKKGLHKSSCENLINHAGWSGSFASITDRTWHPTPIAFETEMNLQYGLQLRYLNSYHGGGDKSKAVSGKSLDNKLGGQLRSLAANAELAKSKPSRIFEKPPEDTAKVDENIPF